jgi:hypothetical protein
VAKRIIASPRSVTARRDLSGGGSICTSIASKAMNAPPSSKAGSNDTIPMNHEAARELPSRSHPRRSWPA